MAIRVLYFIDLLSRGGKERQAIELLKGLKRTGAVSPAIACMDGRNEFERETNSLAIPVTFLVRAFRWDPSVFWRLLRTIRSCDAQIVHTYCIMTTFYALPVCRILGVRLVNGSIRSTFPIRGLYQPLEKLLLRGSNAVIANSAAGLRRRNLAADGRKHWVVQNGFDFTRLECRGADGVEPAYDSQGRKVVGMVASFSQYKDYGTYLEAAELVSARRKDVVFLAIGDGPDLDRYRGRYGHTDSIRFLGKRLDVERIVAAFDIGVLATYSEGISNAVMEYMALAKPVIVSDGGASSEIVVHERTGFLVPPRRASLLAEKIEYLLDNPQTACEMGRQGRKRLEDEFSVDALARRTTAVYEHALGRRLQPAGSGGFAPTCASRE
jgi:glycosyltransferase involved in cell wall biosynthesis